MIGLETRPMPGTNIERIRRTGKEFVGGFGMLVFACCREAVSVDAAGWWGEVGQDRKPA
jgi:hypothetical protein